ncbi:uncharacterized protein [Argopecten irradians]|uniref:uncharacterized protein n=1 Tax=Argopecten irradians TaxID=31199 RepID=UPI00371C46F0
MADICSLAAITEDDELLLLSTIRKAEDVSMPKFSLEDLTDEQCLNLFRFSKDDLYIVCQALNIPMKITCSNGTVCTGLEGFCILLRRLSYPCRLEDLRPLFGRSAAELSYIFNEVLDYVHNVHGHLLENLNRPWLSIQNLEQFAASIQRRDGPLHNCWGFIDGTVRPICRPQKQQKLVFNGHKRVHSLKFQSIVTPNGIVAHLFGPMEGRRHDAALFRESSVEMQMRRHMTTRQGNTFVVYGDPAYPLTPHIITPYRNGVLSANQMLFNKKMSAVRICVEWNFGKVLSLFAFLDYKKNQKLYLQPVGKYYKVATLLTNCHTCLYGSETSSFFGLDPPSLVSYLNE